ncbi:MAG: flippase-like domain-containing protein [Dehalococcoidales bacterium]
MKPRLNIRRFTLIIVALFIIAGVLIIVLDWHEMRRVIGQASWPLLLPAFFFTATSYTCLSFTLVLVFRTFGIRLPLKDLMQIGFVSNAVTYLMNVGGVTGVSLQFMLMKRRGLATEDILAPSLFQLYFTSLMLVALLPIGLFNILASHSLSQGGSLGIGIAAGILTLLLILASVLVFAAPARSLTLRGLGRLVHFITRRDMAPALEDFNQAMTRGVALVRGRPVALVNLLLLTVADWASTVTALWFCFYALGNPVSIGTLLTGFSLGIAAGFVSFIPGGLGVQEGSMAGIYALLGVPITSAVLAAILFRVVYYFLPFLASLGFYRRLLRES